MCGLMRHTQILSFKLKVKDARWTNKANGIIKKEQENKNCADIMQLGEKLSTFIP